MESHNILILVVTGITALALVVFLIIKNQRDKQLLNPDETDALDETKTDQERSADRT